MKLVIDSNCLQSQALQAYLSRSTSNVAVLTDYAAMEAYKGDTLASIFRSMEILAQFPRQVIVLKGTRAACSQRGRPARLQRRLIDRVQTDEFPAYVRHLAAARNGHHGLQAQLLDHGREATAHLDRMLIDAETTGEAIQGISTIFSKDERACIRRGETPPRETVNKIVKNVLTVAGQAFGQHPDAKFIPGYSELSNTFIFRAALCTYLLALDWAAHGGVKDAAPERLRNDFVDMNFAAYATYFDGLMSSDKKTIRLHTEARVWLLALFGCELPSGLGYSGAANDA